MSAEASAPPSERIVLSDPRRPLPFAHLDSEGGFLWWYADCVDAAGDGFVLIWSFGLPFLPGYLAAARRGRAEPPRARPSLNLATYRGGAPDYYVLQTYAPEDAEWQPGVEVERWRFGATRIEARLEGERRSVRVELDGPAPSSSGRIEGVLEWSGAVPQLQGLGRAAADGLGHEWCPLVGPAPGRAELRLDGRPFAVDGLVYHDRNGSRHPLDRLGIDDWAWGRAVTAESTRIYYVLRGPGAAPLAWGLDVAADGRTTARADLGLALGPERRARYGMRAFAELALGAPAPSGPAWLTARTERIVDDGPFYLRLLQRLEVDGREVLGFGETVRPDRVDLDLHRPFVRMRVHRTEAPSSFWLPLFSGPREGRWRRLGRRAEAR
jgi:carotenoid 1,2-hydratase